MNLEDLIETYLEAKKYKGSTISSHRSVLNDFNRWQMHFTSTKMADKVSRYDQFLRQNCFRKPRTAEKQIGVVRRFCAWLEETGRVEAYKLDEQLLGRPEMKKVDKPEIGPEEVMRMLHVAGTYNDEVALRDASMMLLAVTCGLTATEIASLDFYSFQNLGGNGDLFYYGHTLDLPRVTSLLLNWYTKGRCPERGREPLFVASQGACERLSPEYVKERISALLSVVGCSYDQVVSGDCQYRIARYFKVLDEEERRALAFRVQAEAFRAGKMPKGFIDALRNSFICREKRSPLLTTDGLITKIVRDVR